MERQLSANGSEALQVPEGRASEQQSSSSSTAAGLMVLDKQESKGQSSPRSDSLVSSRSGSKRASHESFADYVKSEFETLCSRLCTAHESFGESAKPPSARSEREAKEEHGAAKMEALSSGPVKHGRPEESSRETMSKRASQESQEWCTEQECDQAHGVPSDDETKPPGRESVSADSMQSNVRFRSMESDDSGEIFDVVDSNFGNPSEKSLTGSKKQGILKAQSNSQLFDITSSLSGMQRPDLERQTTKRTEYELLQVWKENHRPTFKSGCTARASLQSFTSQNTNEEEPEGEKYCIDDVLRRCIVLPNSAWRLCWDLLALVFVTWESIMIPLEFLALPRSTVITSMTWIGRFFWTFDLPLSFLTGYNRAAGRHEMRPRKVIKNYLKTWFFIDVSMLAVDWIEVFVGAFSGVNAARMGKTLKSMRMMRMGRVLRLFRLQNVPDVIKYFASRASWFWRSEICIILMSLLKIMVFVIWINHAIACCWYGMSYDIGEAAGEGEEVDTWLTKNEMMREPLYYRYLTSFHWALTQFAGSMEVAPENTGERIYAIIVLLFAFMMSATIVSRITSSMTRLEIATAQRYQKMQTLEQYLHENNISRKLALRVQRNALFALEEQKRNTPESSIELLTLVSEPLRVELHFEMHMPILATHPLLRNYQKVRESTMHAVCNEAISKQSLMKGDTVFHHGEVEKTSEMYFVINGRLMYQQDTERFSVFPADWACEANLWTNWVHVGTLRAKEQCELLLLNAEAFHKCNIEDPDPQARLSKYAKKFVEYLNSSPTSELSDLKDESMEIDELADQLCPPPTSSTRRAVNGSVGKNVKETQSKQGYQTRRRGALKHNNLVFTGVTEMDAVGSVKQSMLNRQGSKGAERMLTG